MRVPYGVVQRLRWFYARIGLDGNVGCSGRVRPVRTCLYWSGVAANAIVVGRAPCE